MNAAPVLSEEVDAYERDSLAGPRFPQSWPAAR